MSKTSWLIALASAVLGAVCLLWLANMLAPDTRGEEPDNYPFW